MARNDRRDRRSALALPLLALLAACGGDPPSGPPPVEDVLARERAAHYYAEDQAARARVELAPLVEGDDARLEDLLAAAAIEIRDYQLEAAAAFLARAERKDRDHPAIAYMRGRIATNEVRTEEALAHFERVSEAVPGDLPTLFCRAQLLTDLDRFEEARALLDRILAVGLADGGSWYVSAVYQTITLCRLEDDAEGLQRFNDLFTELNRQGYAAVDAKQLDKGNLAGVEPPEPRGSQVPPPAGLPPFDPPEILAAGFGAGPGELVLVDLNADRIADLVAHGPGGIELALSGPGERRVVRVLDSPTTAVALLDVENDDRLDLFSAGPEGVRLWSCRGEFGEMVWVPSDTPLPALEGEVLDMVPVDADHDGDLDLALVGDFGARLWRNDGAGTEGGAFTDVSAEAGFPDGVALAHCITEDYDSDQDVDFLLCGPGGTFLMSSLRSGAFEEVSGRVFEERPLLLRRPHVADLDGDSRPDLLLPAVDGGPASLWRRTAAGRYAGPEPTVAIPADAGEVRGGDLDADGTLDLAWLRADGALAGVLAFELEEAVPFVLEGPPDAFDVDLADPDRDCDLDVVWRTARGVELRRAAFDAPPASGLEWIGKKDNRRAIGAICEVRVAGAYRRIYWRGRAELVGLRGQGLVDVVRVTWPNGVVQTELDLEPCYLPVDPSSPFLQSEGLIGSCPFLYTWNGETFEFISDVIGITPLGLPMAPGMLVPPDHDEYVLVRGDQLVPDDEGRLVMQFTEELREVTYLDRIRLDAVDHPAGTRVYPNERFCFPPFPEPMTHVVAETLAPVRAMGSDGRDWAPELADQDDVHAVPFEPERPQFLGLATPHWLELDFDPERVARAERLRLVMTGWFYWTDASVNMAAARTPGVEFVPPLLQVPGGEGGWVDTGPPIGFPAGKTKTMVIDVTDVLRREDPRLRLFSTLRLYWDRIELAIDDGQAAVTTHELEPESGELWSRGFSAPLAERRSDQPERFVWDELAPAARWNQHPGRYTRYGETLPLLTEIDDRYVIMGSGDALTVRFDGTALPPVPEGHVRDWFVFLDGWAKDRDPNTVEALEVEPLPFHGMSGYPYGPDESFPDTPEHRAWREEWNTREAYQAIVPVSPRAQVEWLLGPRPE